MAERFQRLYTLEPTQYAEGCPIIIEAGALLKDTESGAVLAQIKMQNIGEQVVSSCKISITAYENNGNKVEGVEGFSYLDLNVGPGVEFGSKTPIFLPDNTTRKFEAVVTEIVFSDGTVQSVDEKNWKPIPERKAITTVLDSPELVAQFSSEIGCKAEFVPEVNEGLYMCSCGNINMDNVHKCCRCGNTMDSLNKLMDKERLENCINERKRQEADAAAMKAVKQKALRKKIIIGAIALAVVFVIYSVINMIQGMNSILPEKVTWDDTYKQVERKLGSSAEKHPKLRTLEKKDIKHLGYHGRVQFAFSKKTDLLREATVYYDETQDTMEKVLTKKYGEPQERSDWGSFYLLKWVYEDIEITLGGLGTYSCYISYDKAN